MPHNDFEFVPESVWRKELYPDTTRTFLGHAIPEQAGGLWYGGEIERWAKREKWKDHIAAIPEEHREIAAAYLRERWRILADKERRARGDKKTPTGDREMARLAEYAKRL